MQILLRCAALFVAGCSAAFGSIGCAGPPEPSPSVELRLASAVDTVALAPIGAATDALSDAEARAKFEGRAIERLEASGIRVVPAAVFDRSWQRYADDVGGVYDAATGVVDAARFEIVRAAVYRELAETDGVDAVLVLRVGVVDTPAVDSRPGRTAFAPVVCGRKVEIYWPGGFDGRFRERPSLLRSACLSADLFGAGENPIFSRRSLLESIETYDRQSRAVRPRGERFQNEAILNAAVDEVLRPLIAENAPGK